jgi:type IV pilus assembly protein PilM
VQKKNKKAQTYLAIDLGGHSVKFAVGIFSQGKLKIQSAFIERLPAESYENGIIKDAIAVEFCIKNAIKRMKVKEKYAVVTIESSEVIKREITVPKVDTADLMDLITYEVGQYLPIDVNNYVIQYKIIGEEKQNEKEMFQILIGAMPKEMVKHHYDLLATCGLEPVAMDVHTNAVTKLVEVLQGSLTFNSKKSVAYIDFGYHRTDVNVFEGTRNRLNRIIRMVCTLWI